MRIGPLNISRVQKQLVTSGATPPPGVEQSMAQQGMGPMLPFSPGRPLNPYEGYGSPPRGYPFQTGRNIVARPRSERMVSFETMRALTTSGGWDVANICIRHRINSFRSFSWSIIPMEGTAGDVSADVVEARRIMTRPDGRTPYKQFMAKLLGDVFRYDAPTLYKRRDQVGNVIALDIVDGQSIAPQVDYYGRRPDPPATAFVQYINGIPWDWLQATDLIYEPFFPQAESPYGLPPIEDVILSANTDMRMALGLMEHWTEGNIPGMLGETAAEQYTDPAKLIEVQDVWDANNLADQRRRAQLRMLPPGVHAVPVRSDSFDEPAYLWLVRKGCASYGVQPQDIGLTMDVNRATADTQVDIQERIGDRPIAEHMDGLWTRYLQEDRGLAVEFQTSLGAEKEDRLNEANAWKVAVEGGAVSVDEWRSDVYGLPIDNERPVPRFIMTGRGGPIPLANLYAIAGPIDSETAAPQSGIPLAFGPVDGASGVLPGKTMNTPGALVSAFNPDQPDFPETEHAVPPPPTILAPTAQAAAATKIGPVMKALEVVEVAGVVVRAADTGRVLMAQRALDPDDPAGGTFEFPGGHIEPGEQPWEGAVREWQEETGILFPDGIHAGSWQAGTYQCFIWEVPAEANVMLLMGQRVADPDNPTGDSIGLTWWTPDDAQANPALRPECLANPWDLIAGTAVQKAETAGITADTGMTGYDMPPGDPDEDDDEDDEPQEVAKALELRRWRDNSRARVKQGKHPRPFVSDVLSTSDMERVWKSLSGATTRADVDAAFEVRKEQAFLPVR